MSSLPTILIVDDSDVDRRLAGGLIGKCGRYEVQYATSGSDALNQLRNSRPALVLTDLHMPERGGMVVIEACRLHYENMPVVLMTGQGNENLAVEALKGGAAGYVPKGALAEKLVDTIDDVLEHIESDQSTRRLISKLMQSEYFFDLDNDPDLLSPLVEMAQQMMSGLGICNSVDCMRVGMAIKEVAAAAMICGNLELPATTLASGDNPTLAEVQAIAQRRAQSPYSTRRLQAELRFEPREARITVRHQGPALWNPKMLEAISDEQLEDPALRAAVLMKSFCDSADIVGSTVTLVKQRAE